MEIVLLSPLFTIQNSKKNSKILKNLNIQGQEYSITCIQRPLKESNESGFLQQVVFKCRFYRVGLRRVAVSEQWSLKAGGLLIQVVSKTGLSVYVH